MSKRTVKLVPFFLIILFSFSFKNAGAQRYRDRGDQSQQNDERAAQDNPDSLASKSFEDRLVYGANFDLAIVPTFINISPILGYRLTPNLQAGIGVTYIYYYDRETYYDNLGNPYTYVNQGNMYGGRVYAQYDVFKSIMGPGDRLFIHAEEEQLNVQYISNQLTGQLDRTWIPSTFVGVGYGRPIGRKGFFNFAAIFDLNYTQYQTINPFQPVQVRLGVTF